MTLRNGIVLGSYEILGTLGAGGMGEVYRARDSRLGREVAIKVLPERLSGSPERLARFEREARLLAALNHAAVAVIHEVGEAPAGDGEEIHFLVMELIDGETLAERIQRGSLSLAETLSIGAQIASALAAAHEKGVVHRDLKPSNVKVRRDGSVKVLDFGLATTVAVASPETTQEPTVTAGPTVVGAVLGTPRYMSPEQARGQAVDPTTDLWALGCVLYEMLVGRTAFGGPTASDSLAAVLEREPDWSELPRDTPEALRRLLHRCLEKDAERRPHSALDVRNELEDLLDEIRFGRKKASAGVWFPAVLAAAAVLVLLGAFAIWRWTNSDVAVVSAATEEAGVGLEQRRLSQLTFGAEVEQWPTWSPDGSRLVYAAERDGYLQLFSKESGSGADRPLTEATRDHIQPDWSPDGRSVAFVRSTSGSGKLEPGDVLLGDYREGDIWVIDLETGDERRLLREAFNPAFSPDGERLAFDAAWAGPKRIWVTDASGRNPRQVTTDDSEAVAHLNPSWSPDGRLLVFQREEKTLLDLWVVDLESGSTRPVTDDPYLDLDPAWSPTGRWIYFSSYRGGGLNIWRVPVSADGRPGGLPEQLTTGAGQDIQAELPGDGSKLAFTVLSQNADLWRLPVDPSTGVPSGEPEELVASSREDSRGAWSPDGTLLAFNSDRDGDMNVWLHSLADGATRPVTRGPGGDYQPRWSADGSRLTFFSSRSGNTDVWTVEVDSGELQQVTSSPGLDVNPSFSPDGGRIAFQSDRDGRKELWIVNADGSEPRQLSSVGAADHFLRWSDDGNWVYFRSSALAENGVCRVSVNGGEAEPLNIPVGWHMSFSPDRRLVLDVVGHKEVWVHPVDGGEPRRVFVSPDATVRIDYPDWSPDGRWLVFDRVSPRGADVWLLDGLDR